MTDDIWVICIAYDYGVWEEDGYFNSECEADSWIDKEHNKQKENFAKLIKELPEEEKYGVYLTEYRVVKLQPNKD